MVMLIYKECFLRKEDEDCKKYNLCTKEGISPCQQYHEDL